MGFWHAQVTTDKKDAQGKAVRDWVTLDTADMAVAERRLARYLAEQGAGRTPEAAAAAASAPDTVQVYFAGLGKRLADGDNANIRIHVLPTIGTFALDEVQHVQVRNILKKVSEGGARRGLLGKVLGAMRRFFGAAVEDQLIEHNPTFDVKLPKQRGGDREIVKPR